MTFPPAAIAIPASSLLVAVVGFLAYAAVKYSRIIGRIFEERPPFQPMRGLAEPGGEDVRFRTADGLELAGTYHATGAPQRLGVVVFCHEFLGDRHSVHHYADDLREQGFDIFTFDFRNHGDSQSEPGFDPIQWVSDRDRRDLRAALEYLATRPDADPAGLALFGVSRGGGAALSVAAEWPSVWGIVTDGAFPTAGTMLAYILRWAEIYVHPAWVRYLPLALFRYLGWAARVRSERRLSRRFPAVERAVDRLGPRPWLAIHGGRDAYIGPEIARGLFERAEGPKEFWLVPDAKHNRCREVDPEAYRRKVSEFFLRYAPRRRQDIPATTPSGAAGEAASKSGRRRRKSAARLAR